MRAVVATTRYALATVAGGATCFCGFPGFDSSARAATSGQKHLPCPRYNVPLQRRYKGTSAERSRRAKMLMSDVEVSAAAQLICSGISDSGVIELARNCHALKELDLSNTLVTDASVSAIASNCPMLENLDLADDDLRSLPTGGRVPGLITDKSVIALARHCPRLRVLKLSGTAVTDVGMEALGIGVCSLEELTLDGCKDVSDAGVAALLPGLSTKSSLTLRLDRTRITKASVLAIAARFPKLDSLDVDAVDCDVGDEEVLALAHCCPGLRCLHVGNSSLISPATRDALAVSHPNFLEKIW